MGKAIENQYHPDEVSVPGETVLDTLIALGMSQAELAERTGRSKKMINEIIKGKAPITPRMALELERVLGVPASFWNNRERQFREALARAEERERLQQQVKWLEKLPVNAMAKWGWVEKHKEKVPQVKEMLSFFGIASPDQWPTLGQTLERQVQFRKSTAFQVDNGALLAWLRKGELEAKQMHCAPYDAGKFAVSLGTARRLTLEPPEVFQPELLQLCAACGVAVVFVPELPKTRVSGATRWLRPEKALIQLSLRYKTDDHLWFSFFHEAGHILKHGKKEIFIEGGEMDMDSVKEDEANIFAADCLIPRKDYQIFIENRLFSKAAIGQFAGRMGISPGIVVGRLQHDGLLPMSHCNDLKKNFVWAA